MPDYIVEVKFKSIYGPFTYPDPAQLKADFLAGRLPLSSDNAVIEDNLTAVAVKEVKPEK
ncbi:MAG: hypothetical protein AB1491_00315 [Thermodesulfobacteriota bacterium]